jgi:hypothetical protein
MKTGQPVTVTSVTGLIVKTGVLIPLGAVILKTSNLTNIPIFTVGFKLFTGFTVIPVTGLDR